VIAIESETFYRKFRILQADEPFDGSKIALNSIKFFGRLSSDTQ
jgi:hypothetical protein